MSATTQEVQEEQWCAKCGGGGSNDTPPYVGICQECGGSGEAKLTKEYKTQAIWRGKGEFYTGIATGDQVIITSKAKNWRESKYWVDIQHARDRGASLCVYESQYNLLEEVK